jgi:hypothetical protein
MALDTLSSLMTAQAAPPIVITSLSGIWFVKGTVSPNKALFLWTSSCLSLNDDAEESGAFCNAAIDPTVLQDQAHANLAVNAHLW